MRWMYDHYRFP
uniref:Uncharacterized protein n=1 Tax=Moniliophthora roreri TaxID=221103 RepID=A0A0W0FDN2_MONRR